MTEDRKVAEDEVTLLAHDMAVEIDESKVEINRGWTIRTGTWDYVP